MSMRAGAGQLSEYRLPSLIAAIALGAAAVMVGVFRRQRLVANADDPYQYGAIARGLIEHGLTKLTRRAASLYPETIAVVYRLGGSDLAVILLQCLLHAGTCLVVFWLARRQFNVRTGVLAALACALHPMLLRYVPDLHMETMLVFLFMSTICLAARFVDRPTVVGGMLLGAVAIATILTKGVALPVIALFGLIALIRAIRARSKRELLAVAALGLTMALLLAPWTYRNYQITGGRFVLLTPGASDSFLRGYVFTRLEFATLRRPPYTDAENEVNELFRDIAREAGTVWEADEVVDEANNARYAKTLIRTRPLDTLRKVAVGLFTFWYEMTSLTTSLVPAILAVGGWVLAVIGVRRARREGRPAFIFWMPIIAMNVFVAILIPLGRYSVPVIPCLMILAAFGMDTLLQRRTRLSG